VKKHIRITGPTALSLIDAAIKERGADYIYGKEFGGDCRYFVCEIPDDPDDIPTDTEYRVGCLVGQALHTLDPVLDDWMLSNNDDNVLGLFGVHVFGVKAEEAMRNLPDEVTVEWADFTITATADAIRVFQTAQTAQDRDETWGAARVVAAKAIS
jgi:hypothetical protein